MDDYAKVKKESILEMVSFLLPSLLLIYFSFCRGAKSLRSQHCSLRSAACVLQYKTQLDKIKEQAVSTMEAAKRREGLDFIEVDVSKLQPKL